MKIELLPLLWEKSYSCVPIVEYQRSKDLNYLCSRILFIYCLVMTRQPELHLRAA